MQAVDKVLHFVHFAITIWWLHFTSNIYFDPVLLLHEYIEPEGELGLWRIEEPEEWFLERLSLAPAEQQQLGAIRGGRRRQEWLAVRQLVHHMSGRDQRGAFVKDEFGKPHLEGASWQISISHSHDLAAAIAAPQPVGIDIQFLVPKIERIAHRFMSKEEYESLQPDCRLEQLHIYWGAKESLYKAYGRRQLDFCTHILVEPFTFSRRGGECYGEILRPDFHAAYTLHYQLIDNYVLVYACQR